MEYSIDLAITHQITSQGHFCVRLCVFAKAAIEEKLGKLTRLPKENFLFFRVLSRFSLLFSVKKNLLLSTEGGRVLDCNLSYDFRYDFPPIKFDLSNKQQYSALFDWLIIKNNNKLSSVLNSLKIERTLLRKTFFAKEKWVKNRKLISFLVPIGVELSVTFSS